MKLSCSFDVLRAPKNPDLMAIFLHANRSGRVYDLFRFSPSSPGKDSKNMGSTKQSILGNLYLIKIYFLMFKLAFLNGVSLRWVKVFH